MAEPLTDVSITLSEEDGNIFNIVGKTAKQLRHCGYTNEAQALKKEAMCASSYHDALNIVSKYVEVL